MTTRWRVSAMMLLVHALFVLTARVPMPARVQAWLCLRAANVLKRAAVLSLGPRKAKWRGIID